jgi:hypothetical protein
MVSYQLRLPSAMTLNELGFRLGEEIWRTLRRQPVTIELCANHFVEILNCIKNAIDRYVQAYDACIMCEGRDQQVVPGSWHPYHRNATWPMLSDRRRVGIFVIENPAAVDALASELRDDILTILGKASGRLIVETVHRILGPYLYESRVCGNHPNCRTRVKIDHWA